MGTTGTDTTDRVLHIRFSRSITGAIEETLAALDRGETPKPSFETTFHDPDQLHRITRPANVELLRPIARQQPASVRETARLVDRDARQVHDHLSELEALGLIDLQEGGGASKRPSGMTRSRSICHCSM